MRRFSSAVLLALLFISCSKERSEENGNAGVDQPVGDNCKISKLLEIDSASGEGLFVKQVFFEPDGRASAVRLYDSVQGALHSATSIRYNADTARISADEFFLLDANGRARSFYATYDTSGVGDTLIVRYGYDAAGYLVTREFSFSSSPAAFFRYTYTWRNGDLVKFTGVALNTFSTVTAITAELEYNTTVTLKTNLLPLVDAFEVNTFLTALDLGRVPLHPLTFLRVKVYDGQGNPEQVLAQQYRSYDISSDGYILAFSTYAEPTATDPAVSGRARLEYFCR